jgi:hypothetical protein
VRAKPAHTPQIWGIIPLKPEEPQKDVGRGRARMNADEEPLLEYTIRITIAIVSILVFMLFISAKRLLRFYYMAMLK